MSFVVAIRDVMAFAVRDLAGIGSTISAANAAAAVPTNSVLAAAEDEVSTAIASLFSSHAQQFQALSAQAAVFHAQFVHALSNAGGAYAAAEAANASPLQTVAQGIAGNGGGGGAGGPAVMGDGGNGGNRGLIIGSGVVTAATPAKVRRWTNPVPAAAARCSSSSRPGTMG